MLAYTGNYRIQGNEIITHVELSWDQTLTGTDPKRFFKLKDNRLTITTPPLVSAFLGNQTTITTLAGERVK